MKHTKGQWIFNAECKNITNSEGFTIASLSNKNKIGFSNYAANAKLIAAAPELLGACLMAREELIFGGDWKAAQRIIDDAVKKATE